VAQDLPGQQPHQARADRPHEPNPRRPGLYALHAAALLDPTLPADHPLHQTAGGVTIVLERSAAGTLLVLASGPTGQLAPALAPGGRYHNARAIHRPGSLITPTLVNAHTHLDLTHVGPQPLGDQGFDAWLDMVRRARLTDAQAIALSVRQGVDLLARGGVSIVGDIAGAVGGLPSALAAVALRDELTRVLSAGPRPIAGVSLVEFFALGPRWQEKEAAASALAQSFSPLKPSAVATLQHAAQDARNWTAGLSPHAPYSVHPHAYAALAQHLSSSGRPMPVVTHAAESLAERRFIARGDGPLADLLAKLGLLDEHLRAAIGQGRSVIAHLDAALPASSDDHRQNPSLTLVHACDLSSHDIQTIARRGWSVIYCPRAAAYFAPAHSWLAGADEPPLGPHRYQELLAAGVPVALGTDSIINLPAADVATTGLSVWDEMALLATRDGLSPHTALRMATHHGCAALGLPDRVQSQFALGPLTGGGPRPIAGLLASALQTPYSSRHNALAQILRSGEPPELLAAGSVSLLP
jgi:cytosine/adenosine deaminase-related metal-dependent hydrolase